MDSKLREVVPFLKSGHLYLSKTKQCFKTKQWFRPFVYSDSMLNKTVISPWWRLQHSVETSAKLFSELKLVTDNLLSIYAAANW